jgi:aminoglycoside/choline kinase family phosphotransferase
VREALQQGQVRVPGLYAADLQRGYLLLVDLGDRLLLEELTPTSADACYQRAFHVLHRMLEVDVHQPDWPAYDEALLGEELGRFPIWFVEKLLEYSFSPDETELWQRFSQQLISSALEQPRVLVHRDFHSRNLMPQADGQLAVIDFQDAVRGPITYDLASLLRDCYVRWPAERVQAWALQYRDYLQGAGYLDQQQGEKFLRWFDWMGLQRHIKVLGTFARLYLRDGKPGYLEDLPLVIGYVEEILDKYADDEPLFADFQSWFGERLTPLIAGQSWSGEVH